MMDSHKSLITAEWDVLNFQEPVLQQLHDYWRRQRGARAMPARPDIDVAEIPALLPYIFVIDVLENPRDFRFRVAGTHMRQALGEELTGRHIADAFPPDFGGEVEGDLESGCRSENTGPRLGRSLGARQGIHQVGRGGHAAIIR